MKKYLFLFAILAFLFASCNIKDEPKQMKEVTFNVAAWTIDQQPMNGPRRVPILDDNDGLSMTDLFVFDAGELLVHQTNDQQDFGVVTLTLEYGSHNLSFVSTRSDSPTVDGNLLKTNSLRPTFGKLQTVTVSDATDAFDITLSRLTGQIIITFEDEIPADAHHLVVQVDTQYNHLNVTTFAGANAHEFNQSVNIVARRGLSGERWTLNMLTPIYGTAYTTDVSFAVYRQDDSLISRHSVEDVPICSNTKTLIHGAMFSGQAFTVSANYTWEDDVDISW